MIDLHTAGHRRGIVAAPHHAAVEAGRAVLAEGGNALEATVAMAASIGAVYPHMAQLGGDGVWLMREPSGRVRALIAAGRASANARREVYREHETIPPRGGLAALTAPGAIAGWMLALEAAKAFGGRMGLGDLLAPAVAHAKAGASVTKSQARYTSEKLSELEHVPGFAQVFLLDGKPPNAGERPKKRPSAPPLGHPPPPGPAASYCGVAGAGIPADPDPTAIPATRGSLKRCRA